MQQRSTLLILSIILLSLVSCQKEIDWATGSGTGGGSTSTSGDLLVKTEAKNGSETVTTVYTYNANKKLINEKITGTSQGMNVGNEVKYYRNAAGILTRYTQINPNLVAAGIDSVVNYVNYNTTTSRYTSYVNDLTLAGFTVRDSVAIIYNAAGKVIQTEQYQKVPLLGPDYDISVRIKYTYDATGNIIQQDFFSVDPVTLTEGAVSIIKYTYDAKVAAIKFDNEAFVIGKGENVSAGNVTKADFIDVGTPANGFVLTNVFNYNSTNRPSTCVSTKEPGAVVNNVTYTYQ